MLKTRNNEFIAAGILFTVSTVSSVLLNVVGKSGIAVAVLLIAVTTSTMLGVNTLLLSYIPLCYSRVGLSSSLTGMLDALAYIASAFGGCGVRRGLKHERLGSCNGSLGNNRYGRNTHMPCRSPDVDKIQG